MLAIKLRPVGKKKQISFRIVVVPKRSKLKGRFVEDLGWYNPHTDLFSVNKERAQYWVGEGAQPTDSVHNILISAHVIEGAKRAVHATSKKQAEEKPAEATAVAPEPINFAQGEGEVAPEQPAEAPAPVENEAPVAEEKEKEEPIKEAQDGKKPEEVAEASVPKEEIKEPESAETPAPEEAAPAEEIKEETPVEEVKEEKEEPAPAEEEPKEEAPAEGSSQEEPNSEEEKKGE
jgi:small subunit ribosomal protein S16